MWPGLIAKRSLRSERKMRTSPDAVRPQPNGQSGVMYGRLPLVASMRARVTARDSAPEPGKILRYLPVLLGLFTVGCSVLPEISHQPTLHNPFPQLSKVAVAPFFFNASDEPTVDGRQYALAYYNELQLVPGFEVVPPAIVERQMQLHDIALDSPEDAQRLAQLLDVDALVVGSVNDFSPYYPPRCALHVEWYAANPCFHSIPPGYGLPWGTPEEKQIPAPLVFEAEMALAKAQLKTQTPSSDQAAGAEGAGGEQSDEALSDPLAPAAPSPETAAEGVASSRNVGPPAGEVDGDGATGVTVAALPGGWPDPRGLIPPPPRAHPPICRPSTAPVMQHTRAYNGHDPEFTEALASYYYFRDDARFSGWQSYLERSDDFIRFCTHMHIWEMLSARGGAGETRVVWRWPSIR